MNVSSAFEKMPPEDLERLAKAARENPRNTAGLIWSLVTCVTLVVGLVLDPFNLGAVITDGLQFLFFQALLAILIGAALGGSYYFWRKPIVARARAAHDDYERAYRAHREAEKQAQIAAMKTPGSGD